MAQSKPLRMHGAKRSDWAPGAALLKAASERVLQTQQGESCRAT